MLVAVRYCQFCVAGPGSEICWGISELGFLSLIRVAKSWSIVKLGGGSSVLEIYRYFTWYYHSVILFQSGMV